MAQITLTSTAVAQIKHLIHSNGGIGLRVGVKPSGCSGYSYVLDMAQSLQDGDEVFERDGAQVVIDSQALAMLDGTEVDYVNEGLNRLFKFNNPNVKDACGCGESFSV